MWNNKYVECQERAQTVNSITLHLFQNIKLKLKTILALNNQEPPPPHPPGIPKDNCGVRLATAKRSTEDIHRSLNESSYTLKAIYGNKPVSGRWRLVRRAAKTNVKKNILKGLFIWWLKSEDPQVRPVLCNTLFFQPFTIPLNISARLRADMMFFMYMNCRNGEMSIYCIHSQCDVNLQGFAVFNLPFFVNIKCLIVFYYLY